MLPAVRQCLSGGIAAGDLTQQGDQRLAEPSFVHLIEMLFDDPEHAVRAEPTSSTTRAEYASRVCTGGFPLAARRSPATRARWFDDYVRLTVERDAVELARIRQRSTLATVLNRLAGQTGQVLNISAVSSEIGADRGTVTDHVQLLEDVFLVQRLPAWGTTLRARATKLPKVHLIDSGLASRLGRTNEQRLATLDPAALTEFGHLLETFVVGELRKQTSWMAHPVDLGHWRTSDGDEIDVIAEHDDGRVIAFEVKASQRISDTTLNSFRKLREALGARFVAGVAFSTGERSYTADERIHVMPLDRLWRPVPD